MNEFNGESIQKAVNQYQDSKVDKFSKFETGAARTVFEVKLESGKELILYLCTKEHVEQRFEKEELLIELVNRKTDIPTPKIVYSDFSKEEIPYLFYIGEKIEGYNPVNRYKYMPKEERTHILRQSANYLAELHENVKFEDCGDIIYREGELMIDSNSCYEYITDWAEEWIEKMGENRFSDLQDKAWEFMEEHKDLAETSETSCVHFDVRPENLIVKDGEIQAVIDWEKAISLAPEWDLQYSMVLFIYGKIQTDSIREGMMKEFFQAYLEERQLDENWGERLLYFNTVWTFKGMAKFEGDFPEEQKEEVEEDFRKIFNERYENLEKAAEKQLPKELVN